MASYLERLTANIEEFALREKQTIVEAHQLLWEDINLLRLDPNYAEIASKWKYGKEIELIEIATNNKMIPFGTNVTWEQSFVFGLLLYIFH
jgi:hypothetical protein